MPPKAFDGLPTFALTSTPRLPSKWATRANTGSDGSGPGQPGGSAIDGWKSDLPLRSCSAAQTTDSSAGRTSVAQCTTLSVGVTPTHAGNASSPHATRSKMMNERPDGFRVNGEGSGGGGGRWRGGFGG